MKFQACFMVLLLAGLVAFGAACGGRATEWEEINSAMIAALDADETYDTSFDHPIVLIRDRGELDLSRIRLERDSQWTTVRALLESRLSSLDELPAEIHLLPDGAARGTGTSVAGVMSSGDGNHVGSGSSSGGCTVTCSCEGWVCGCTVTSPNNTSCQL
jgi:hypothetical protein